MGSLRPACGPLAVLLLIASATAAHAAVAISCSSSSSSPLQNCVQLAPNVVVRWAVANGSITINHTTAAPGIGWMALGLSETGSMKGADMWVLQREGGGWNLTDQWATGFQRPQVDRQQDLVVLGVVHQPAQGLLSVTFRRHLAPCDTRQDLAIQRGYARFLLYAWGTGEALSYHGNNRGSQSVVLYPSPAKPAAAGAGAAPAAKPGGVKQMNVSISRVKIPTNETTYMYQFFKLPSDRKYHILNFKPRWGTTKDKFAHHAVIYACAPSLSPALEALPSRGPMTASSNMTRCNEFYMLTTPWTPPYQLPPQAGLPFGRGSYTWWMLEMHYNNPDGISGKVDEGSGITLEYTSELRPADMGLMTITQLDLTIPPGKQRFDAPTSYCTADCTKRWKQPLNLVAQTYHMHGLGKSAVTRRWRGGQELAPLGQLAAFDYKFQSLVPMPEDANVLMPGDELAFTCTFDSTSRTNVTMEGPGTRDEMCFHWIYFWPAQQGMGLCASLPAKDKRPALEVCAADFTPLFGARDPQVAKRLYAAGLLLNVTVPKGKPYRAPVCTAGLPSKKQ